MGLASAPGKPRRDAAGQPWLGVAQVWVGEVDSRAKDTPYDLR